MKVGVQIKPSNDVCAKSTDGTNTQVWKMIFSRNTAFFSVPKGNERVWPNRALTDKHLSGKRSSQVLFTFKADLSPLGGSRPTLVRTVHSCIRKYSRANIPHGVCFAFPDPVEQGGGGLHDAVLIYLSSFQTLYLTKLRLPLSYNCVEGETGSTAFHRDGSDNHIWEQVDPS